ncbi:MAG: hypothetical protein EXS35_17525 [Pedosphaera sp.]|nr:hypothetical protein [Pedosphaera sp.]
MTCASAADGISGSGYNTADAATSLAGNKFYKITITADATHSFVLTNITWLATISSGTGTLTVKTSNSGGPTNDFGSAAVGVTGSAISASFNGSVIVAPGTSVDVFFIPSNLAAVGTTCRFKNNSTFSLTAYSGTAPTVSSSAATSVTTATATLNGSVDADGGSPVIERGFVYKIGAGVAITDNKTAAGSGVGAYNLPLTGLAPSTLYSFKAYAINYMGTTLSSPELTFTTDASVTPTLTAGSVAAFGNVEINTTSATNSYSLSGSALTPASGNIAVSPPAGFEVSLNQSTWVANPSSMNVAYTGSAFGPTPIYVRFKPTAVQPYSGDITYSGGAVSSPPTTALSGSGVKSSSSDIIRDPGFTEPVNIDYTLYQADDILNAPTSIEVARFKIRDGQAPAAPDGLTTTLSNISLTVLNPANLRRVALYDGGGTEVAEVAGGASPVTFSALSGLSAADAGTANFSLRATFKTNVTDHQQIRFTVNSATADSGGSVFAVANAGGAASDTNAAGANQIVVTATKLAFTTMPTNVGVGLNFTVAVAAQDANNNTDLDVTTAVTLSKASGNGTLSSTAGLSQVLVAGRKTWSDVQINSPGTFTIQAAGGSYPTIVSGDIIAKLVLAGWDVSAQPGGANNYGTSPLPATIAASGVTVGGLTRGAGVVTTGTAAASGWGGLNWTNADAAAAIAADKYATVTVTANSGNLVSFSAIGRFDYRRSGTGPTSGVIQYQVGAADTFHDLTTVSYTSTASGGDSIPVPIDLSGTPALQNVPAGTVVTFRVVNYGGTGSAGTWYVYDKANSTANDFEIQGFVTYSTLLTNPQSLGNGGFSFAFTNTTGIGFAVLASTNVALPMTNWTAIGTAVESPAGSGQYQFTNSQATNYPQRFYRVALLSEPLVLIPSGTFTMGDTLDGLSDALPTSITVSSFYMDRNLVSLSQWQAVYGYATSQATRLFMPARARARIIRCSRWTGMTV